MYTPARVLPRNGFVPTQVRMAPTGLGQINPMDPVGRDNLAKAATAAAMGGAAAYALMKLRGASKKDKVAIGAVGGGLALLAILNIVDIVT